MLLRAILGLILSVALAVASVGMAMVRTHGATLTEMVICSSGNGITTVTLDMAGNPVEVPKTPVHLCPDCLAGAVAGVMPDLPVLRRAMPASARIAGASLPVPEVAQVALVPSARGPPVRV